jgi:hypothetical protein
MKLFLHRSVERKYSHKCTIQGLTPLSLQILIHYSRFDNPEISVPFFVTVVLWQLPKYPEIIV